MTRTALRALLAATTLAAATVAGAQESSNVVATEGAWTVFAADEPRECWAVSPPQSTQNTDANGAPKEVTRGDIRLYVAYRPGQDGEVSFTGGYPFAPDSTVEVDVGGAKFNLFTEGESAWTGSQDEDKKLIGALRAGSNAVISARSARGTMTKDTFSLSGVTAATDTARERCQ